METIYIKNGDKRIYSKLYLPGDTKEPSPAVILCHGFGGNGDYYNAYAKLLTDAGYAAVYFDFCGGGSDSRSDRNMTEMSVLTEAADLNAVVDYVAGRPEIDDGRLYLMGESQGGFVAAYIAARRPMDIAGLVLFYPAFVLQDDAAQRREVFGGSIPETYQVMGHTLGRRYMEDALSFDIYDEIGGYKRPVLILHGDSDGIVPYSYSERAAKIYDNARLVCIPGAGHGFHDDDERAAGELMMEFLMK